MNTLYANGCSLTFGMEILGDYSYDPKNLSLAWPRALADLHGIKSVTNAAYCGASNEFILRRTITDLLTRAEQGEDPKDVLVVIGWSSVCRQEINLTTLIKRLVAQRDMADDNFRMDKFRSYGDHGSVFMNAGFQQWITLLNGRKYQLFDPLRPLFQELIWDDRTEMNRWAVQQIALADFLSARGYRWLMFNTVHTMEWQHLEQPVADQLKRVRFYKPDWAFQPWVNRFYPDNKRACGHPDAVPHQALAHSLYDYMQTNALIA